MKIPEFEPSHKILGRYDAPCLVATVKNSNLPGVAARYIAEFKKNPACKIYLRGKNPKVAGAWEREMLEQFFEKEQLAPIIESVLTEYEKKAGKRAYMLDEKERDDFEKRGIAPFMTVSTIVIDGTTKEVVIVARCDPAMHFAEHGLNIYLKNNQWGYDDGEYLEHYRSESIGPTATERREQLQVEKLQKKWDELYPPAPAGTPLEKDFSYVHGRWEVDKDASFELCNKLGWRPCRLDKYFVFSADTLKTNHSRDAVVSVERRGNWCIIRLRRFWVRFWSDGETLVDDYGHVFRRRDPAWRKAGGKILRKLLPNLGS
jgi:hypothetical protein